MGTKHRGKRMFYYKYFTLNKMKEVHIMSKKILKRSLALGALMAFVITGSAMAGDLKAGEFETAEDFKKANGLAAFSKGSSYCNFYIPYESDSANELVTTDKVIYKSTEYGGNFGLFAGCSSDKALNQHFANPNQNTLNIKNDFTVNTNGYVYLYGGCIDTGADAKYERTAKGNSVYIGDGKTEITITAGNHIFIGGALCNDDAKSDVIDNKTVVSNVKFELSQNKFAIISGAEARSGNAKNNTVEILNTTIENASILGGFVYNEPGSAISNYVKLNNAVLGDSSECAGGYVQDVEGKADDNTVDIGGNSKIAGKVYGGYSDKGTASNNTINIKDTADVSEADLYGDKDGKGTGNTLNVVKGWQGTIGSVQNFDAINIEKDAVVTLNDGLDCSAGTVSVKGGTLVLGAASRIGTLEANSKGKVAFASDGHLDVDNVQGKLIVTEADETSDKLNTVADLDSVANKLGVTEANKDKVNAEVVIAESSVRGAVVGDIEFETVGNDGYYHGVVNEVKEKVNTKNKAIGEAGVALKLHWRAHMNDMNKRLGELRDANGERGVWTRMVRGESEYENTKAQYNQYQLGYDEKLSIDERWTVGAAATFAEGDASYANGSTDDKSTAFAIYGSKLNDDGTFVDLIARYTHLESDLEDVYSGKGDYSTNGMSVSAEFGKRIQQGRGLWVEPQVELTYGTFDSAELKLSDKTAYVGDMDSLIGRFGFRIGKDLEQGNVYARASYLYDFDGETENTFSDGNLTRTIKEDLGGGWWEVGIGTNINLSKATYIYADIEKTFGGEVDTNWQWNLGVRYSF